MGRKCQPLVIICRVIVAPRTLAPSQPVKKARQAPGLLSSHLVHAPHLLGDAHVAGKDGACPHSQTHRGAPLRATSGSWTGCLCFLLSHRIQRSAVLAPICNINPKWPWPSADAPGMVVCQPAAAAHKLPAALSLPRDPTPLSSGHVPTSPFHSGHCPHLTSCTDVSSQ